MKQFFLLSIFIGMFNVFCPSYSMDKIGTIYLYDKNNKTLRSVFWDVSHESNQEIAKNLRIFIKDDNTVRCGLICFTKNTYETSTCVSNLHKAAVSLSKEEGRLGCYYILPPNMPTEAKNFFTHHKINIITMPVNHESSGSLSAFVDKARAVSCMPIEKCFFAIVGKTQQKSFITKLCDQVRLPMQFTNLTLLCCKKTNYKDA